MKAIGVATSYLQRPRLQAALFTVVEFIQRQLCFGQSQKTSSLERCQECQ